MESAKLSESCSIWWTADSAVDLHYKSTVCRCELQRHNLTSSDHSLIQWVQGKCRVVRYRTHWKWVAKAHAYQKRLTRWALCRTYCWQKHKRQYNIYMANTDQWQISGSYTLSPVHNIFLAITPSDSFQHIVGIHSKFHHQQICGCCTHRLT